MTHDPSATILAAGERPPKLPWADGIPHPSARSESTLIRTEELEKAARPRGGEARVGQVRVFELRGDESEVETLCQLLELVGTPARQVVRRAVERFVVAPAEAISVRHREEQSSSRP
jgi:hypothetical protein